MSVSSDVWGFSQLLRSQYGARFNQQWPLRIQQTAGRELVWQKLSEINVIIVEDFIVAILV